MKKKWLIYGDDMIVITDNSDTDSHVTFIKHDLDTETSKLLRNMALLIHVPWVKVLAAF